MSLDRVMPSTDGSLPAFTNVDFSNLLAFWELLLLSAYGRLSYRHEALFIWAGNFDATFGYLFGSLDSSGSLLQFARNGASCSCFL